MDRVKSLEIEAEKLRKDNAYLVSRSEGDITKLNAYLNDCEFTISD